MIKEKLGKRISELRKRLNISQEELAEKLDISQKSLSKIETGRNFLSSETLEKLLNAFNITSAELFDYDHLDEENNLLDEIHEYIETIKEDKTTLTTLYKIIKALAKK